VRIEILGTRGHMKHTAPGHMFHSGVLVDDILFDIGEKHFLDRQPRAIFLTHFHADHAFFTDEPVPPLPAPAYAPQPWREHPEIKVIRSMEEVDGITVTAVPTNHSANFRSCGYIIEDGISRIMYTGDLISVQKRFRDRIPDLDLVVTDGAFIRQGGLVRRNSEGRIHGHTGIPDLVRFFSPLSQRIVFTHFGSWFFKDITESEKQIEALSGDALVEAAFDGMVIEL